MWPISKILGFHTIQKTFLISVMGQAVTKFQCKVVTVVHQRFLDFLFGKRN